MTIPTPRRIRPRAALAALPGRVLPALAFADYALRRYAGDRAQVAAAALTFASLLALVPLTTIAFSIFAAFPAFQEAEQRLRDFIFDSLVPQVGDVVESYINTFVEQAGTLTAVGIVGLAVTALLVLFNVESSFNAIWRVRRPRPVIIRVLAYWACLTLVPLLLGASVSILGAYDRVLAGLGLTGEQAILPLLGMIVPLAILTAAIALLYIVIPNRGVRWRHALAGAVLAALALWLVSDLFGLAMGRIPTYQTIYGALAAMPIFLVWLYIVWTLVLAGAELAAAMPEWRAGYGAERAARGQPEGQALTGRYLAGALDLLAVLWRAGQSGRALGARALESRVAAAGPRFDDLLARLVRAGWIAETERGRYVLMCDLAELTVYDLLRALGLGLTAEAPAAGEVAAPGDRWQALITRADAAEREVLDVPVKTALGLPTAS